MCVCRVQEAYLERKASSHGCHAVMDVLLLREDLEEYVRLSVEGDDYLVTYKKGVSCDGECRCTTDFIYPAEGISWFPHHGSVVQQHRPYRIRRVLFLRGLPCRPNPRGNFIVFNIKIFTKT